MNDVAANLVKKQAEGLAEAVRHALAADPKVEALWSRRRTADYLGVSVRTVDRLAAGQLRRIRIGKRSIRFHPDEVRGLAKNS